MEQQQADGGQSMGLRERKRRATRDAIERAAIALVSERGYDNVTVAQICELSSVSQGTFFNYFRTKDAAIVGIGEYDLDADSVRAAMIAAFMPCSMLHATLTLFSRWRDRSSGKAISRRSGSRSSVKRPRSCSCSWTTRSASSAIFAHYRGGVF